MKMAQPTPLHKHLKCLYARRYTCLYVKRVGTLMFTKCLLNSLQKMEFLREGSKILNRFVWIFLIEFCKELKSIYQSEIIHDAYLSKIISETKGQLISKGLFGILNSSKKRTKKLTNLLWYLRSTCFRSFFGRIWRYQKDISKLTDL